MRINTVKKKYQKDKRFLENHLKAQTLGAGSNEVPQSDSQKNSFLFSDVFDNPGFPYFDLQQNLIDVLELPESILGQNLFPRKYQATFEIHLEGGVIIGTKFLSLLPTSESMPFIDEIVLQCFLKKLKQRSTTELNKFFTQQIGARNTYTKFLSSSLYSEYKSSIILEFKEPN